MSDDDNTRLDRERAFVRARLVELYENPIQGNFDTAHLKAVHAYIFQNLPEHQPGIIRGDTDGWSKAREIEGRGPSHVVKYLHEGVEGRIDAILRDFGGPDSLRNLAVEEAALRLAKLYGDLDHAHGFYEGNSRTLREFTRELASAAGHILDWTHVGQDREGRNALYVARDVQVLERAYPDLTPERAMETPDRAEYHAWWHLKALHEAQGRNSLESIIKNALTPQREMHRDQVAGRPVSSPELGWDRER